MRQLDEVDVQILAILQTDGRLTNAELAKRIGLSPPSALQRVRILEQIGAIKSYVAILDQEKLGFKLTALAFISLELHQDRPIERFKKAVDEMPEVLECLNISGEFDFVLKIVVRDMRAYETLIRERLSKIRGVGKIQTSFVLGTTKQITTLPIIHG